MSAWDDLQPVWIHSSQNLEAVQGAREASLRLKQIDHTFHYASPRQSELWLAVHHAHSPAQTDRQVEKIYRDLFTEIAPRWKNQSVHIVALGCGGSHKDTLLIEALDAVGARVRFTPVDVSPTLALLSAQAGREFCDEPIRPLVADLLHFPALPEALASFDAGEPRLFTFFGLIPNFEPAAILPHLRGWLRPQDQLLLSANLAPAHDESPAAYRAAMDVVRPQYDNAKTRAWLSRVLMDWGLEARADSYALSIEEHHGLLRFVAAVTDLRLFFSYRYTPERLRSTLAAHGLALGQGHVSPSREEGVWSVSPV